jgi:alpha-glutamyl/putrescinyl thymine pyrophosphorylase clade 1
VTLSLLKEFAKFVTERYDIYLRRQAGEPAPWTKDPILQRYRFCNVRREDDRVTRWLHDHWLRPHEANTDLWFAMVVARLINKPESLEECGFPIPWRPAHWRKVLNARKQRGETVFSAAYMIRAIEAKNGETKVDYLAKYVLAPLWAARSKFPRHSTLDELHQWLLSFYGMGSFLAAQVLADIKWAKSLRQAADWRTFAASGPGSCRGLNRVCGQPVTAPWKEPEWRTRVLELRQAVLPLLPKALRDLDAQNIQNALCEFDKYMRAKNGEGRPKQLFKPSEEKYV